MFIYALIDERNRVRYVGSTTNMRKRFKSHLSESSPRATRHIYKPIHLWLQAMQVAGLQPRMMLLERCSTAARYQREWHWIRQHRSTHLTNVA